MGRHVTEFACDSICFFSATGRQKVYNDQALLSVIKPVAACIAATWRRIMRGILISLLTAMVIVGSPIAALAGDAVSEMATIVINLKHYPSEAEKKQLKAIIDDRHSTAGEKLIAGALMRMQHQVGDDDAKKLMKLEADETTPDAERQLSRILRGIAHQPTDEDIRRLNSLNE